jgi:hypothetical protein
MRRIVVLALGVLLALALAAPLASAQVGQGAKASGKASELAADWWQWALAEPVATNPLVGSYAGGPQCDGRPVSDVPGKKWFLAGSFDGSTVERTCTMPVGTQLFFPVGNYVFLITEPEETEEIAREAANGFIDAVLADPEFSMIVTVDGKEVKSKRIVRADSPLFSATVPENNLFSACCGLPAGDYDAVADGLWAALPPLSKGEHTIHFEISAPSLGFSQDNTYYLTVVNGKRVP